MLFRSPLDAEFGVSPVDPALKVVTAVEVIVLQLVFPDPSVIKACPLDPAEVGRLNVHDPLDGACSDTVLAPDPIKANDPVRDKTLDELFQLKLDAPDNKPVLL